LTPAGILTGRLGRDRRRHGRAHRARCISRAPAHERRRWV